MRHSVTYRAIRRNGLRVGPSGGIGPKMLRRPKDLPRVLTQGMTEAERAYIANHPLERGRRTIQVGTGSLRRQNGYVGR